jgi:tRNA1Val (adenine37-N6)-methyltransferase
MEIDPRVETLDTILGGRLALIQPKSGYRFAIDAVLLGDFARPRRRDRVLDLGAGCGVVAAIIAASGRQREVVAVELQPTLAAMARRNATLNQLGNLHAFEADLRSRNCAGLTLGSFDLIVANPPYRAAGSGRESPNPSRRLARGASGANLRHFVAAAARYSTFGGRVAMVFAAPRAAELLAELKSKSLEPKRCCFVHPYVEAPATLILVEARKGGGVEVNIEPPLILWKRAGVYTAAARAILGGEQITENVAPKAG